MRRSALLAVLVCFGCAGLPVARGCPDEVRGVVRVVGSLPLGQTVMETDRGDVRLTGPLAAEVAAASGLFARVRGRASCDPAHTIEVETFRVLRLGMLPVVDGVLRQDGDDAWTLVSDVIADLDRPPMALRGLDGARVWVLFSPLGEIVTWGVLNETTR